MTFIEYDAKHEPEREAAIVNPDASDDEVTEEVDSNEYPVDGHDHTIVCLDLGEDHDLLSSEPWKNAARAIASNDGFDSLLYSYDLDHERRFIAAIRWRPGTSTHLQIEATEAAFGRMPGLAAKPSLHHIVMGSSLQANGRQSESEIYIIQGNTSVIKPDLLRYVHDLAAACLPQLGEDLPQELSWVTYGVNPLRPDGVQIISFMLSYVSDTGDERLRFQDPKQATFPRGDRYESLIAKPIDQWTQQGAIAYRFAVRLQLWQ